MTSSAYQGGMILPSTKLFSERLNACLDEMGVPTHIRERAVVVSKMLDIPKQKAWALLEGHQIPDHDLIQMIATEFEVDPHWLTGEK